MKQNEEVPNQPASSKTSAQWTDSDVKKLQQERDDLLKSVRELAHAQLIGRDLEIGLRNELLQAQIELRNANAYTEHVIIETRKSKTWRIGNLAMTPLRLVKRVRTRVKGK